MYAGQRGVRAGSVDHPMVTSGSDVHEPLNGYNLIMCMTCIDIFGRSGPLDLHLGYSSANLQEGALDAPSEIGSASPVLSPGDLFFGDLSLGDVDVVGVNLDQGQAYTFRIDSGQAGQSITDTYIRIFDSSGVLVSENDDIDYLSGNYLSSASITAQYNGTYFVEIASYETFSGASQASDAGSYSLLTFNNGIIREYSVAEVADYLADGYWGSGPYTWNIQPGQSISVNTSALNVNGKFFANAAMDAWSAATGIQFSIVSTGGQIVIDDAVAGSAYSNFSYNGQNRITSAVINVGTDWILGEEGRLDSYSFQTYIHEFGHALGLGHGGNYNGSAIYGSDNVYLNDSWHISVMSYFDQIQNTYVSGDRAFAITPMAADILAIRNMYGSMASIRSTNTIYGESGNTGSYLDQIISLQDAVTYTIVDDGGIDTLNFGSSISNNFIDLRGGSRSNVNGVDGALAIYTTSVIENVILGSGNDSVTGNDVANRISLGSGINSANGAGGSDTAVFSGMRSAYTVTQVSQTQWTVTRLGETTTLNNFETAEFADTTIQLQNSSVTTAKDDSFSLPENLVLSGSVFSNNGSGADSAGSGGSLSVTLLNGAATVGVPVTLASGAILTLNSDGSFSYNPGTAYLALNVGESEADSFTYTVTDGSTSSTATVTLIIQGAAPVPTSGNDLLIGVAVGTNSLDGLAGDDVMIGRVGENDTLWGNAGNDTIYGDSGYDLLIGEGGTDFIYGGNGFDVIYGDHQDLNRAGLISSADATDALFGENGNDTIYGGGGGDGIDGGSGDDLLYGDSGVDWIYGGTGLDTIYGGTDGDALFGEDDNDTIYGEDGNDSLDGGWGNDSLFGGNGVDFIYGGFGNDNIDGGADTDSIQGQDGDDTIDGGLGDDGIDGGYDNDILFGGAGTDWIYGGFGDDLIYGHTSSDDGTETDALFGQEGNDTIHGGGGGDSIDGGTGNDYLYGEAGNDWIFGQEGDDVLGGGLDSDVLFGGSGNDELRGGQGGDSLDGGDDDDILNGGAGVDVLFGGAGADTFVFSDMTGIGDVVRDFISGTDRIEIQAGAFGVSNLAALAANQETGAGLPASFTATGPVLYIETFWKGLWIDPDGGDASNMFNIFGMETGVLAFSDIDIVA